MAKLCKICHEKAVPPLGPKDAEILIIGEFPGQAEIDYGVPFVGPTGKILKAELGRVGMDFRQCRVANLWVHAPNKNEACYDFSLSIALKEAKDRKGILLLGSECAKTFLRKGVMDVSGLEVQDDCEMLSAPLIMCAPNPAILFHGGLGEFRLAMDRFSNAIDKYID